MRVRFIELRAARRLVSKLPVRRGQLAQWMRIGLRGYAAIRQTPAAAANQKQVAARCGIDVGVRVGVRAGDQLERRHFVRRCS